MAEGRLSRFIKGAPSPRSCCDKLPETSDSPFMNCFNIVGLLGVAQSPQTVKSSGMGLIRSRVTIIDEAEEKAAESIGQKILVNCR